MGLATAPTAVAGAQAEQLSRRYGRRIAHVPNGVHATELVDREGANAILRELGVEPQQYWLFAAARVDPLRVVIRCLRRTLPSAVCP